MRYYLTIVLLVFLLQPLGAQELSLQESTEQLHKVLEASKLAKSGNKEKNYQEVLQWERKLAKELNYIKKLQGKSIQSDEEAYKKLLSQAYGFKEMMLWQSEGLEVSANSPLGITCALVAIKILYPNNPRQGISQLNGIYKHHAVATSLYEDQNKIIEEFFLVASKL